MKKLYMIFFVSFLLFSCSNDNNDSKADENGGNIPVDQKLLQSYTSTDSNPVITYNDDKTVKRLVFGVDASGTLLFDFRYKGGVVSEVFVILGGNSATFFLEHQNGIVTSFHSDINDQVIPVNYNAATNAYTYTVDNDDDCLIDLTPYGDIEKFSSGENPNSNFTCLYIDDENKYGPMANTNSINL